MLVSDGRCQWRLCSKRPINGQTVNNIKSCYLIFSCPRSVIHIDRASSEGLWRTLKRYHLSTKNIRWQWCWWHRYVGDFMMVTDLRCWWQNHYVGDFFRYVGDFLNVLNRSSTHLVSNIRHQHRCNQNQPVSSFFIKTSPLKSARLNEQFLR